MSDDDYNFYNMMRIWTGSGYEFYGWAGTSGTDVDGDSSLDNTWTDMDAYAVEDVFMPTSSGVWIVTEKAGTLTASGEVILKDVTININEGYNLICNPFPCEIAITDFSDIREDKVFVATHIHSLSNVWNKDSTGHWHNCSGCNEKIDFSEHTEDEAAVGIRVAHVILLYFLKIVTCHNVLSRGCRQPCAT